MRSCMSYRAKRELLLQIAPRYREASSRFKEVIMDEFVAATGYARSSFLQPSLYTTIGMVSFPML